MTQKKEVRNPKTQKRKLCEINNQKFNRPTYLNLLPNLEKYLG